MLMYPFDHVHRNWDVRLALHREASKLLDRYNEEAEDALNIEDDDAYDARMDEISETTMKRFWEIHLTEFALCYPESRNEWFINFVNSFAEGSTQISEKQYRVFKRYCEDNDETWRTYTCYCRVGNKLISLKWKNSNRSVEIKTFKKAKDLLMN